MRKLLISFLFIACLFMTACSNDDDIKQEISCEYFEATTWDAKLTGTQSPNPIP